RSGPTRSSRFMPRLRLRAPGVARPADSRQPPWEVAVMFLDEGSQPWPGGLERAGRTVQGHRGSEISNPSDCPQRFRNDTSCTGRRAATPHLPVGYPNVTHEENNHPSSFGTPKMSSTLSIWKKNTLVSDAPTPSARAASIADHVAGKIEPPDGSNCTKLNSS